MTQYHGTRYNPHTLKLDPFVIEIAEDAPARVEWQGETLIRQWDDALGMGWHNADWTIQVYVSDRVAVTPTKGSP